MKLLLPLSAGILLLLGFTGSGALAAPKENCTGPISGTHGSVTVTGTCAVTGPLTIDGDLTLADDAVFVGFGPAIHVTGNVKVGKGAQLALGYNRLEGVLGPDTVDGNLIIHGWTGGWWGAIANTVGGNVDVSNNTSVVHPAGACPGTFPLGCAAAPGAYVDSSEVQSRGSGNPQRISGNLICHGNTPTAQINTSDGGAANIVGGNSIGECPPRTGNNNP